MDLKLDGYVTVIQFRNGEIIDRSGPEHNVLCHDGMDVLNALICDADTEGVFKYIAVGESSPAASWNQTTLQSELVDTGLDRSTATLASTAAAEGSVKWTMSHQFAVTGTKTVQEAGLFNSGVEGGSMLCRQVFTDKNVESGDTLEIEWEFTVTAS